MQGTGNKTIDLNTIINYFKSLNVQIDIKRIEKIQKTRNNVEHYCTNLSQEEIKEDIANTFIIICDFITKYLNADPKELLGKETWDILLAVNEVFESQKRECQNTMEQLTDINDEVISAIRAYTCQKCRSELIKPIEGKTIRDAKYECQCCAQELEFDSMIEYGAIDAYDNSYFTKDGEEANLENCPECFLDTYLVHSDFCLNCLYTRTYSECKMCGEAIPVSEQHFEGLCAYCDYKMSKDN